MNFKRIIFFLLILLLGLFFYKKVNYTPSEYEKKLINYFSEVALESEYSDNPQRIIKWKVHMILYISKDEEYECQVRFIIKTINNINRLATDGFRIELSNDILKCNAVLYLCNSERLSNLNPNFYQKINNFIDYEVSGISYTEFSWENYIIDSALIYINSEDLINVQKSTILEEITQSIGLSNDPLTYPSSIFYKNKSKKNISNEEYTKMDSDIVRLLYHPKMESGLNSRQTESTIKRILKAEAKNNTQTDIDYDYETKR